MLVTNLVINFQDLVAKVKNLVTLAPVLGAISCPELNMQIITIIMKNRVDRVAAPYLEVLETSLYGVSMVFRW